MHAADDSKAYDNPNVLSSHRQTSIGLRALVNTHTPRLDQALFRTQKLEPEGITALRAGDAASKIKFHPLLRHLKFLRHTLYEDVQVAWPNLSQEDWFDEGRNRRPLHTIAAAEKENAFSVPFTSVKFDAGWYPEWHECAELDLGMSRSHRAKGHKGAPITVARLVRALATAADPIYNPRMAESEWNTYGRVRFEIWRKGHISSKGELTLRQSSWDEREPMSDE